MYAPHVSDLEVRTVIAELSAQGAAPSGAALRAELRARFGSRGGVARIYRLLSQERDRLPLARQPESEAALQFELQMLRQKLAQAQEREDIHQARWAEEVDRLRQQVASLEPLARQTLVASESTELLRHQLQASQARAATLERQLILADADRGEGR